MYWQQSWYGKRGIGLVVLASLCWQPLLAQAQNGERYREEIVVSAQKRDQDLQDVGLSVSVLGQELLEDLHVDKFDRLADFVPGLQVSPGIGSGNPVFTIRGIGSTIIWSNNNPSVAVHVDEMYYSSSAFMSFPLFDLARVEVLKGPQGTLYGRNSTAGVINVLTAEASEESEFTASMEYGRDAGLEYRQVLNGGLGSDLSGRLAIYARRGGGYQNNRGSAGISEGFSPDPGTVPAIPELAADSDYGEINQLAFRAAVVWTPMDLVDVNFSIHNGRDRSDVPIDKLRNKDSLGFVPPSDDPYTVYVNRENDADAKQRGGVLRVNVELGDTMLSSVSGYEELDRRFGQEDGSPYRITDGDFSEQLNSFTQELRWAANSGAAHQWLIGAYISQDDIDFAKDINIVDVLKTVIYTGFKENGESWAVFAHDEWQLSPQWALTTGLRYTDENKRYRGGTEDRDPWGVSTASAIVPQTIAVDREYTDSQATGHIGIDYAFGDRAMMYASVSMGFKSGGFDGSLITSESATLPYDAEQLLAYEVGFKNTLIENLLTAISVFYYDYNDKQVQATVDVGGGVTEAIIQNAAASESHGVELEITWTPSPALRVYLGSSYVSTEITDWDSASGAERMARIGNELPNAPEWTANAAVDYRHGLNADINAFVHTDVSYSAGAFREISNNPDLASDDVSLLGAKLGVEHGGGDWSIYIWGRNLSNEEYRSYSRRPLGAMITDQYGLPRMIGIGGSIRFGS